MRETLTKPRLLILVASLALSVALLFAAKAQASESGAEASKDSFGHHPPDTVLMKGDTTVQQGLKGSYCWSWWNNEKDWWEGVCGDTFAWRFPPAPNEALKAGSRLHIRVDKPERPHDLKFAAYKRFDKGKGYPTGKKQLISNLKPVKRDDDIVAWDVFFRVNEPNRNYYLDFWASCGEENGFSDDHVSGGDSDYTFHVKTKGKGD